MDDYKIELTVCVEDFERVFGRKPKSEEEFKAFCSLCEKGLMSGHIDWDILYDCAKDAMEWSK